MKGDLITGNLVGMFAAGEAWNELCKQLIAMKFAALPAKERPTLEKAPDGHWAAIIEFGAGADFATLARRALLNNKQFERRTFYMDAIAAQLEVFGKTPKDLSRDGRERAVERMNKAIDTLINTFVFFGLFEPIQRNEHTYRLTEL